MRLTRRVTLGIAFALLLTGCSGRSAPAARAATSSPPPTMRFTSGEAARGIPFRLVDDQIVLAVTINDSLTLDMVLDTGMPIDGAMLLDPKLGERLGLRYVQQIPLGGGGSEGPNLAGVAPGATLGLPGITFGGQTLLVLQDAGTRAHWPVAAILGRTLMAGVVEIDYEQQVIHVSRRLPDAIEQIGEAIPLTFQQGIPAVAAAVAIDGGAEVPVELLVDTGTNDPVLLRTATHPDLRRPARTIRGVKGVLGEGLNGPMGGSVGRIDRLTLGSFALESVWGAFLDDSAMGTAVTLGGNGLLGNEALQRFHVVFDYSGSRMFLRPNARFPRPFEFDMAGLVLQARSDHSYSVLDVILDSPAARAGIAGGDVLVAADGKDVRALPSEQVFSMLRKRGARIALTVERGKRRLTRTVVLERLI